MNNAIQKINQFQTQAESQAFSSICLRTIKCTTLGLLFGLVFMKKRKVIPVYLGFGYAIGRENHRFGELYSMMRGTHYLNFPIK
jgi:hypothetical protein